MLLFVVFLFIVPYLIYIYLKQLFSESSRNFHKIPGPKGLPLVGNIQDYFYSNEKIWHLTRARALQFYPIYKLKIFNQKIVHLIDPTDIEVILKDSRYMSKSLYDPLRTWIGEGLLLSEGETWRKRRKLLTKCFHFGALANYMQSFNDEAGNLTESLKGSTAKPFELNQKINKHTFKVALDTLLGKHYNLTNESAEDLLKALKTLTRITGMKGQDTTALSIVFILYILANKPRFQEEIYEEIMQVSRNETPTQGEINQMNCLDRFVKECFRTYTPAPFIGRLSSQDVSLPSGFTIPAGTLIFVDIFDVHRNPNVHHEPEKFDPDRFLPENSRKRHPYSFIPFSAGPRNCIAQKFAILAIKTMICGILKKFRVDPVGRLEDIILVPDLLLRSKFPMKVIFISRSDQIEEMVEIRRS